MIHKLIKWACLLQVTELWWNVSNNLSPQPTTEEIFDLTLQLKFIPTKLILDSTFFIIFTNNEKISSKLIHFFLKEFISLWISLIQFLSFLSLEAQIFSKLIARYSSKHLISKGSTISSGGYYFPCSRPSWSFTSLFFLASWYFFFYQILLSHLNHFQVERILLS